jgi:hypothetical protein
MNDGRDPANWNASALIAAAPDLLAACDAALQAFAVLGEGGKLRPHVVSGLIEQLGAAVAKARVQT